MYPLEIELLKNPIPTDIPFPVNTYTNIGTISVTPVISPTFQSKKINLGTPYQFAFSNGFSLHISSSITSLPDLVSFSSILFTSLPGLSFFFFSECLEPINLIAPSNPQSVRSIFKYTWQSVSQQTPTPLFTG